MNQYFTQETAIGVLTVCEQDEAICRIFFGKISNPVSDWGKLCLSPLLQECYRQLDFYFRGRLKVFRLPVRPIGGTPFMRLVWNELAAIPYASVMSYGEVARRIGHPKACRAVGMACHRNPVPIIVPCHRVIGTNSKLVGYAWGTELKQRLLTLEQNNR